MQNVFLPAVNDSMARIVTALASHDDIGVGGEHIDDLPLPFVAPLRADQDRVGHGVLGQNFVPTRSIEAVGTTSKNKSDGEGRKTILAARHDSEVAQQKYAYHPIGYSGAVINRRASGLAIQP